MEDALCTVAASPPVEPYARRVPPRQSLRDLEAQITELTGHLNAATYYWLTLIAEFDRREGWGDGATRSCAHWLNWKCGIDLGAARERVRVAHALEKLPRISEAMREGRLSYSKARAITRVASEATDYQTALDSLLFRERRAARVSAATSDRLRSGIVPAAPGPARS